jgi:hypothetical protein
MELLASLKKLQADVELHILKAKTGEYQPSFDIQILEEIKIDVDTILQNAELVDLRMASEYEYLLFELTIRLLVAITEVAINS